MGARLRALQEAVSLEVCPRRDEIEGPAPAGAAGGQGAAAGSARSGCGSIGLARTGRRPGDPFPSLLFVGPLVVAYEVTILLASGTDPASLRSGADAWMRRGLAAAGLADPWFLPLLLVVILMGWQIGRSHDWRFSPTILAGMIAESLFWAIALLGVGRLIDLGFSYLEQGGSPLLA